MREKISHWIRWAIPKWHNCANHCSSWWFSWGPITIWKETRYYRTTGYFLTIGNDYYGWEKVHDRLEIYSRWHIPCGFEWRFKNFTPTAEENAELDRRNYEGIKRINEDAQN